MTKSAFSTHASLLQSLLRNHGIDEETKVPRAKQLVQSDSPFQFPAKLCLSLACSFCPRGGPRVVHSHFLSDSSRISVVLAWKEKLNPPYRPVPECARETMMRTRGRQAGPTVGEHFPPEDEGWWANHSCDLKGSLTRVSPVCAQLPLVSVWASFKFMCARLRAAAPGGSALSPFLAGRGSKDCMLLHRVSWRIDF